MRGPSSVVKFVYKDLVVTSDSPDSLHGYNCQHPTPVPRPLDGRVIQGASCS